MAKPSLVRRAVSFLVAALVVPACLAAVNPGFTLFESGQVRPLALSPSGKFLFAANTPDGRLEVFRIEGHGLAHRASIPVGLEPVAVAARSDSEVWVVNHLSDSVSVVELDGGGHGGRVVRTLLVGDEPRDIVFAGPGRRRAFITTAHRGQNAPFDPQLTTPGIGRADVWVFDADHLGTTLAGTPLTIVTLFSDTPRALAVTPDGSQVYAAAFHSGNRTTSLHQILVPDGGEAAGGSPGPATITRPSAGERTARASAPMTRSGSRKKKPRNAASSTNGIAHHHPEPSQAAAAASNRAPPTKGAPARSIPIMMWWPRDRATCQENWPARGGGSCRVEDAGAATRDTG